MLVLCSDGIHKHVEPGMIGRVVHEPTPLAQRCLRLVELARTFGRHDDATVLVVQRKTGARSSLARLAFGGIVIALVSLGLAQARRGRATVVGFGASASRGSV